LKITVTHSRLSQFSTPLSVENYCVFAFQGVGLFAVDAVEFAYAGNTLLFLSPYQHFQWKGGSDATVSLLQFHGDFYCIEYHKKEVACNGLLFNAIFLTPHIEASEATFAEIEHILQRIEAESNTHEAYSEAVLKSYLQLILALSSKEKSMQLTEAPKEVSHQLVADFQGLLNTHFVRERGVQYYAEALHLQTDTFSKRIKSLTGKSPTKLIQERVVLEAKKLLHLTHKSIKEVAFELNFEDEFYFSRFFKKTVGLSPKHFRERVGISIVAV